MFWLFKNKEEQFWVKVFFNFAYTYDMCNSECLFACLWAWVVCMCILRPKTDKGSLHWLFFTLSIEQGPYCMQNSLTFARPGSQLALDIPGLCFLHTAITRGLPHPASIYMGWGIQTPVFYLKDKHFLSHFSGLWLCRV